jgi:phage terminase small subunit
MKPPSHLSPDARRWWANVSRIYALEHHHLRLLTLAAEAWDLKERARRELADAGALSYEDSAGNLRPRPEIAVARDARAAFARFVRQLDLDSDEPRLGPGRPLPDGDF